jgi:hypothetical protein
MAIKPKQILDTAVDVGKSAVGAAERRIRGRKSDGPSGAPSTVGAAKPGTAGAPKSSTAPKRKPKAKAKAKPRKPAKKRATATRAAATSGSQVKRAAKNA